MSGPISGDYSGISGGGPVDRGGQPAKTIHNGKEYVYLPGGPEHNPSRTVAVKSAISDAAQGTASLIKHFLRGRSRPWTPKENQEAAKTDRRGSLLKHEHPSASRETKRR